jgi:hypothetical protein
MSVEPSARRAQSYGRRVRDRVLLTGIGAGVGLAGALAWWFLWGCHACAKGSGPSAQIVFSALMGVVMANAWGMDHLRARRGRRG